MIDSSQQSKTGREIPEEYAPNIGAGFRGRQENEGRGRDEKPGLRLRRTKNRKTLSNGQPSLRASAPPTPYRFTCTTFAGGKPLKCVDEACV